MIQLDNYEKWLPLLDSSAEKYLSMKELEEYRSISKEEKESQLRALLQKPIANFTVINEVYFRARWAELINILYSGSDLSLLEIASGDADMIPQVMACTHPESLYLTANMNKLLNESLLSKTSDLNLRVKLIDDDAANITEYIEERSIDIIAFQHSINDVIQAILCDREGVDTIYSDWMETLPEMIKILQNEIADNTLEKHAKPPFLSLIKKLLELLNDDGIIAMNHYMFQLDLDWGYPAELFNNIIPMTREWLKELNCCEVFYDGFDPHWWIFLKKE